MKTFFTPTPTTLEELKALYRKLAMQYHPDKGGCTETMKQINAEHDRLFEKVKNYHRNAKGETYTKETTETPEQFRNTVDALIRMNMVDVEIELCGSFLWVSGNTKPYKDDIKGLGFKWSTNKSAWYMSPPDYRKVSKRQFTMNDIRDMFGSEQVRNPAEKAAIPA